MKEWLLKIKEVLCLGEYTNLDMVKSLVRAVELLTEENKELRQEIKGLRNNYGYCTQLTNEQEEELKMVWKGFKEGR